MKKKTIFNIVFSGICIGLVFVLPFLTGQIPQLGQILCLMHIPVIICGYICGWKYGLVVGFASPILRSLIFTMPPIYPTAVAMSFELATYGFMTGFLHFTFRKLHLNDILNVYITLITAMLAGRIIWGGVYSFLFLIDTILKQGVTFSFQQFLNGAFIIAFPGIVIQIVLIPLFMISLEKTKIIIYDDEN